MLPSVTKPYADDKTKAEGNGAGLLALVVLAFHGVLLALAVYSIGNVFANSIENRLDAIEPMVGPAYIDSFNLSCDTSATAIRPANCGMISYSAMVDDAAGGDVFFGDSGVTTTIYGQAVGPGEIVGGNVRQEYCIAASAAKTIHVRALCSNLTSSMGAVDDVRYGGPSMFNIPYQR